MLDSLDTLEQKYKSLNKDPYRIDQINERLFELKSLQRKYGKTTKEILDKYNEYKEKLNLLDNFESEVKKINTEIDSALKVCNQKALLLKEERIKAANKLSKDINSQLANLGLLKNGFKIEINDKELSIDGIDDVKFLVSLNVGLSFAPLKKVASGGESSRLMLALKTVLNKLNPYDLVVFDEIDTGISGQIASLVAKNIKSISSSSQIIVISHLPQVVASTDQGIYVSKEVKDNKTYASISNMDEDKFILEVAKMLSGNQVTNSAILQAKELIKEYK